MTPAISGQEANRYEATAERFIRLLNAGDYDGVQKIFAGEMDAALPADKAAAFFRELKQQQGNIKHLGNMRQEEEWAVFTAQFERGTLDLRMALNESNRISGLLFVPTSLGKRAPARNETTLSLPFKGKWLVGCGGDTSAMNQHHDVPNQKFAYDLIGVDDNGWTRGGQTNDNEDYFAFGREVLAPADGVIVEAIDGVRDNEPGAMNPYSLVGNCVVIRHRDDEFSVLAHFKQCSVRVEGGEKVKRGDVLGLCGNSGNSSEPHLHYHLQHESRLPDGMGIKAFFERVVVHNDGKSETRSDYSPIIGDVISRE